MPPPAHTATKRRPRWILVVLCAAVAVLSIIGAISVVMVHTDATIVTPQLRKHTGRLLASCEDAHDAHECAGYGADHSQLPAVILVLQGCVAGHGAQAFSALRQLTMTEDILLHAAPKLLASLRDGQEDLDVYGGFDAGAASTKASPSSNTGSGLAPVGEGKGTDASVGERGEEGATSPTAADANPTRRTVLPPPRRLVVVLPRVFPSVRPPWMDLGHGAAAGPGSHLRYSRLFDAAAASNWLAAEAAAAGVPPGSLAVVQSLPPSVLRDATLPLPVTEPLSPHASCGVRNGQGVQGLERAVLRRLGLIDAAPSGAGRDSVASTPRATGGGGDVGGGSDVGGGGVDGMGPRMGAAWPRAVSVQCLASCGARGHGAMQRHLSTAAPELLPRLAALSPSHHLHAHAVVPILAAIAARMPACQEAEAEMGAAYTAAEAAACAQRTGFAAMHLTLDADTCAPAVAAAAATASKGKGNGKGKGTGESNGGGSGGDSEEQEHSALGGATAPAEDVALACRYRPPVIARCIKSGIHLDYVLRDRVKVVPAAKPVGAGPREHPTPPGHPDVTLDLGHEDALPPPPNFPTSGVLYVGTDSRVSSSRRFKKWAASSGYDVVTKQDLLPRLRWDPKAASAAATATTTATPSGSGSGAAVYAGHAHDDDEDEELDEILLEEAGERAGTTLPPSSIKRGMRFHLGREQLTAVDLAVMRRASAIVAAHTSREGVLLLEEHRRMGLATFSLLEVPECRKRAMKAKAWEDTPGWGGWDGKPKSAKNLKGATLAAATSSNSASSLHPVPMEVELDGGLMVRRRDT